MSHLDILSLDVTHNNLRNRSAIDKMAEYIESGGFWTEECLRNYALKNQTRQSPLIQISCFDDGKKYIHDGHHRIVSIFLGGRTVLAPEEYQITNWTYALYLEISHENNWYTPFDLRTHCRTPDFAAFKKQARQRFINGEDPETIKKWILENPHLYCEPREISKINELV